MLNPLNSQFFKDSSGQQSMTLLLLFLTFWPSTWIALTSDQPEVFYAYLGAFTGLAINKQWAGRRNVIPNQELETVELHSSRVVSSSNIPNDAALPAKGKRPKRRAF